ncbi:hypothetical protein FUA26_00790 [Seonamhaeicola algicola]|uniref:Uncharacterized protein n=1 Tax=Seonamhaeicola algicola TaxID=1719036 RepID=A0A5C7B958_9FLAO|nr:hypothetical protein [Seonamhaeicola algicola]TXE15075.1 hypothetical protein FUA26_00790 [Seonamhaeicola algicola]
MTVNDLEGTYTIIGTNQNETNIQYRGTLTLTTDDYNRVVAKWLINNQQKQTGYGFFKDHILVINFEYLGVDNDVFTGVVVYKCLTKDILEGFWSETYGDPNFLGTERCFRVKTEAHVN